MPLMLLSNPGLPLAVLGNPGGRRRRGYRATSFRGVLLRRSRRNNPRSSTMRRRRHHRRNPVLSGYVNDLKAAPKRALSIFTGPHKVRNILFTAGGGAATYLIGGLLSAKVVAPLLSRVPVVNGVIANPIGQRVIGALIPFTVGFVASKFVKGDVGRAALIGGGLAGLIELVKPGMVGQLLARVPGVPMAAAAAPAVAAPAIKGPTQGLSGYVAAPSYAGVGGIDGYVAAPSYAGVGDEDQLAGYVAAPSYAGVGDEDELEGAEDVMAGIGSYLDQASQEYTSYLANP